MDADRAQRAVAELLQALDVDLTNESLQETPRRVAAAYAELLTPQPFSATTFPNDEGYDEMVVARKHPVPLALRAPPDPVRRRRPRRLPAG